MSELENNTESSENEPESNENAIALGARHLGFVIGAAAFMLFISMCQMSNKLESIDNNLNNLNYTINEKRLPTMDFNTNNIEAHLNRLAHSLHDINEGINGGPGSIVGRGGIRRDLQSIDHHLNYLNYLKYVEVDLENIYKEMKKIRKELGK
jgi:hypothetical protein